MALYRRRVQTAQGQLCAPIKAAPMLIRAPAQHVRSEMRPAPLGSWVQSELRASLPPHNRRRCVRSEFLWRSTSHPQVYASGVPSTPSFCVLASSSAMQLKLGLKVGGNVQCALRRHGGPRHDEADCRARHAPQCKQGWKVRPQDGSVKSACAQSASRPTLTTRIRDLSLC